MATASASSLNASSSANKASPGQIFNLIVFGVFLLVLVYQYRQISWLTAAVEQLEDNTRKQSAQLEALSKDVAGIFATLQSEKRVQGLRANSDDALAPANEPTGLKSGLYVLTQSINLPNYSSLGAQTREMSIYHLKAVLREGAPPVVLNFGVATSGYLSVPIFYFDYDEDGWVDMSMMRRFIGYIPFSGLLARTIDPRQSQAAYSALLNGLESAKFTPINKIREEGGKIGNSLLEFIEKDAERLTSWIDSTS